MTPKLRVLLADDHAILLDSLRSLLQPTYTVVGAVTDGRALLQAAVDLQPDVIVTDITMPGLNGLDAIVRIRQQAPKARVIVLTVDEDPDTAAEAIRRGASGYVVKSSAAPELFEALRRVSEGSRYVAPAVTTEPVGVFLARSDKHPQTTLSLREREVLQLLAEGRSMAEAATSLGITRRTVAFHKYAMMKKLGFRRTAELIRHAVDLALVKQKPSDD
jgi:DNA-binding NarL/FixJ family response regulator